jgi:hypothetical protein
MLAMPSFCHPSVCHDLIATWYQTCCPGCGQRRHSKGYCNLSLRTLFGKVSLESGRLHHCDCQSHATKTFSPLAELLLERTTPEMLYLETKWSSLMSYDRTAQLLEDTLPMDAPVHASTIREHVCSVAQRLENELGEEQWSFIEGCQRDWNQLPQPDGPLTVGIDGGYIRGRNKEGHFEVIAGKSLLAFRREQDQKEELSSKCFAFVQTYDEKPKRRLFEVLRSQGLQMNQQVDFLSDGGEDVRNVQLYLNPEAEHLLDCLPGLRPRNSMKIVERCAQWIRSGKVVETIEKSKLLDCLIRSVRD